jgi:limonene-1,2-epoxide hydrolase
VQPFRAAIEAGDIEGAIEALAEEVVFHSPVAFTPYRGRAAVGTVLRAVFKVFEDFTYVREIGAPGAADHALVFRARIGATRLEGCDFLHLDDSGAIDELTVMVRPRNGLVALAEAMTMQLAATLNGAQAQQESLAPARHR